MSTLLRTYPIFESNQVLTSTQLNTLFNYLEEQNRMSRARLIGMGVVCGLEVSYDAGNKTISISKGTGITSEGHLTTLEDTFVASRCRLYKLPGGTIYGPFVDAKNKQDVTLHELLTDDAAVSAGDEVPDSSLVTGKVVLLFIESFDKDLKSCLGKSCDELGKQRKVTLRPLLISTEDLKKVWSRTNTGKFGDPFPEKFNLPVINLPRVLFDPESQAARQYKTFGASYANAILAVFKEVHKALLTSYDVYQPLLMESYSVKNPFSSGAAAENLKRLQAFLINPDGQVDPYLGIQYVYDFFRDMLLAYDEFRQTAFELMSQCCPDMQRFPKHLMLGEVIAPKLTLCESPEYRHLFVQPPVYNLQQELVRRTVFLHNRMVLMAENFDLDRVNGFSAEELVRQRYPIRITPSLEKQSLLGDRSIPWYYAVNRQSKYAALGKLKEYWNYTVSRMCPDETGGLVLNYDDQSDDLTKAANKLSHPLYYDIDEYPFLRIEGHTGKDLEGVLKRVSDLRTSFNLPFQTLAVQLEPQAGKLAPDYRCGFEDIQEEYGIIREEITSFHREFITDFKFLVEKRDILMRLYGEDLVSEIMKCIEGAAGQLDELLKTTARCLEAFAFNEFRNRYKALLVPICVLLLIEERAMQAISDSEEPADNESPEESALRALLIDALLRVFEQAHQLDELLFYRELLPLYFFFKRREHYMMRRVEVFSDYLREHPGLDHQAGVPKGGTFIVLYQGAKEQRVIADFALPCCCCDPGPCVPMCDTEQGGFVFDRPPFARPDYAITQADRPIAIDVLSNDVHLPGDDFIVEISSAPKQGAVEKLEPAGRFLYVPEKGFAGRDVFEYEVISQKTKEKDAARVMVLVQKAAEVVKECYSEAILKCWGKDFVGQTLEKRGITILRGQDIYSVLLTSLRETGGFTAAEIKGGVLESSAARAALLKCLGIQYDANASYEVLGNLITAYQKTHCSAK